MKEYFIRRMKNVLKHQAEIIKEDDKIDVYEKVKEMNVIENMMEVLDRYNKKHTEEEMNIIEKEDMGYGR